MANITGFLSGLDSLTVVCKGERAALRPSSDDTYVVTNSSIQSSFRDFPLKTGDDVDSLQFEVCEDLYELTAYMVLSSYVHISSPRADWDMNNAAAETGLPSILLHKINALRPRVFYEVLKMHNDSLGFIHFAQCMVRLKDELRAINKHISCSQSAKLKATLYDNCTVNNEDLFEKAWAPFAKPFKFLSRFCSGLTTVFSGTAAAECNSSNINLEIKDYHGNLNNLSFENGLQSKTSKALGKLNHT